MAGITEFEGPKPRSMISDILCNGMYLSLDAKGRDIDAMLPFLSAYMGHARYEDTLYMSTWFLDFYERVGTVDRTAWENCFRRCMMKVKDAQFFTVVSSFLNVYLVKTEAAVLIR